MLSDACRIIAEHAIDPIFVTDSEGRVSYANPAAERVFGFSAQEFKEKSLHDLVHRHYPDGRPPVGRPPDSQPFPPDECPILKCFRTGEVVEDNVVTFFHKNGTSVVMSATSSPIFIEGKRVGHLVFARDISKRLATERALAESEQRLRLITDSMPQPVWVLAPDGGMNFVNARFRQMIGGDAKLGADYVSPVHPDDLPRTQAAIREALQTGHDYRIEHRARLADGSYHWFLSHGVPLKDAHGKLIGLYGSSTDIDDIRRATDALRKSQETLRLATEAANLGLWEFYIRSGKLVWNDTNRRIYGLPLDGEISYDMFIQCVHPDQRESIDAGARKMMRPGGPRHFDTMYRILRNNDGAERWVRVNAQVLPGADGRPAGYVGTTLDITDSKLAEQRIREASQRDLLTGLPNRALLFEYCGHLLAVAQRTKRNGALLFVDLDRFKPINDTHGHDVGDQVLKQVAKRLQSCTRQEDVVGRLGGDEFVVALPHPDDVHGPATVAQHIVDRVSAPYYVGALQLHLSPSIGISLYPRHGENLDTLVRCADNAMYEAKKAGRKCYRFYTPALGRRLDKLLAIELQLRHALEHNELLLHYQPVVELESGRAVGVEALLRLPVPDAAPLAPAQFMPAAESAGLLNLLGEWVVREACRQQRRWRDAGLPPMMIAINVAPQQFRQDSFITNLADNLRHCGMNPACLQIELKESLVLEDLHDTVNVLEEIRRLGVRVALDNFGVGYSNVGLLSSLPLDKLKIDKSFVSRIGRDPKSQTITDTVLALGRSLHLKVVGEGIESQAVFDYLRHHGCDQAQGFYFSKPLTASEFERWFRRKQPYSAALQ